MVHTAAAVLARGLSKALIVSGALAPLPFGVLCPAAAFLQTVVGVCPPLTPVSAMQQPEDDEGVDGSDLGLCLTGSKVLIPEEFVPVTEDHTTLPQDYHEAAALTTHNNGLPSAEAFKPGEEVRVGESGLVLPAELMRLKDMVDLLADFNARLRDLHRRSEQMHSKPFDKWRRQVCACMCMCICAHLRVCMHAWAWVHMCMKECNQFPT